MYAYMHRYAIEYRSKSFAAKSISAFTLESTSKLSLTGSCIYVCVCVYMYEYLPLRSSRLQSRVSRGPVCVCVCTYMYRYVPSHSGCWVYICVKCMFDVCSMYVGMHMYACTYVCITHILHTCIHVCISSVQFWLDDEHTDFHGFMSDMYVLHGREHVLFMGVC